MELSFQTSSLSFLRCVLQELRQQEETAETIVPDTYPDIASIVDAYAVPVIRGKDCRDGSVILSGGIKGGILYHPEDASYPRSLDFYIPFTTKLEDPALTSQSEVISTIRVRSVDGKMVNSRKAMLRVNLCCYVTAYVPFEEQLYSLKSHPDSLQLQTSTYPLNLPLETIEKSFVLSENLELVSGRPPIAQIHKTCCDLELTDSKLVGNKAVFKGTVVCKILYAADDQTLHLYQQKLPFSQYCELRTDYDNEHVVVQPVMTGYDLEPEHGDTIHQLTLTVHVLAQCTVFGTRNIELIEDAYVTDGVLRPQWHSYDVHSCLDRKTSLQTIQRHLPGEIHEILDTDLYWNQPVVQPEMDQAKIRTAVQIHVLGLTADHRLCALTGTGETLQELSAASQVQCHASIANPGNCYAAIVSDGVDVRCEVTTESRCYGGAPVTTLIAGTVDELSERSARPSVILRRAPRDARLWDLAKEFAAREESIRAANHLEGDVLPEDTLLLIPIG